MATNDSPDETRALTPKQQRFVDEYTVDWNGTQAAIRAGYSEHTANEQGSQLLAKLSVQSAVREIQAVLSADSAVKRGTIVAELASIAYAPISKIVTSDNKIRALDALARIGGHFIDRRQVEVAQRVELVISRKDD